MYMILNSADGMDNSIQFLTLCSNRLIKLGFECWIN